VRIKPKNWESFQHYKDRNPPWIRLHRALLDNQEFNEMPPMACKVLVMLWLLASESSTDGVVDDDPAKLAFRMRLPVADVAEAMECIKTFGFIVESNHADISRDSGVTQRLREKNGFGSRYVPDQIRREVWIRDGGKCRNCGGTENLEYDHINPVSRGGQSSEGNIQLLCRPCNRKKRTKTAEQLATPVSACAGRAYPEAEAETETEAEKKTLRVASDTTAFVRFWEAWPDSPRKVAKAKCAEVWKRKHLDSAVDQIVAHVSATKGSNQWQRGYEPAPLTYLNQRRWEDGPASTADKFAGAL
jgi:hypothetical protein